MHEGGSHSGDMPNIYAGSDGHARADVFVDAVSFSVDADDTLFDDDGSAIIIPCPTRYVRRESWCW